MPISSDGANYNHDGREEDLNCDFAKGDVPNCHEIFFVHRSMIPDPEEVSTIDAHINF